MIKITGPDSDNLFKEVLKQMLASEGFCFDELAPIEFKILGDASIQKHGGAKVILHHDYNALNKLLDSMGVAGGVQTLSEFKTERVAIREKTYPVLVNYSTSISQNVILSADKTPLCIQSGSDFIFLQDILTISRNLMSGLSHISREKDLLDVPLLNIYSSLLASIIEHAAKANNIPIVQKARWPDEYQFAIALTHDIERIIPAPKTTMDRIKKKITHESPISPIPQFKTFIEIEKKFNVNSTYFFLDNTSWFDSDLPFDDKRAEEVIKLVADNGDEIGLHGSFFSYPDHDVFSKEKARLEKVSGMPVKGNRQHFLNMDVPHTWKVHEAAGIKYDTTQGYNDRIGFRAGSAYPFKPLDMTENRVIDLWQIPMVIMDVVLFREKPWLSLSLDEALEHSKKLLQAIKEFSGGASILWHPEYFMDEKYTSSYEKVLGVISDMKGWMTTGSNVTDWLDIYNSIQINIVEDNGMSIVVKFSPDGKKTAIKADHINIYVDYNGKKIIQPVPLKNLLEQGEFRFKL